MNIATRAAEIAARESYGKLLAILSSRCRDISLAEDCLAEAFAKALDNWALKGVPANPDAWLLTVARNKIKDHQRKFSRLDLTDEVPDMMMEQSNGHDLPDERLALLLVCAHPALPSDLHTPLMLQTVLGVEAKVIAGLFLVSPAALAKRLVRAKAKIRDAGISFTIPEPESLVERAQAVYEAIYAIHALDWLDPKDGMGEEAIYLANLLAHLLPNQAEASGLASLIAYGHSRRNARIKNNILVPLEEQETALWDIELIRYAELQLNNARRQGQIGRFQLEAAIQSVHMNRRNTGATDWQALNKLYFALLNQWPSAGALVAHAMVTAKIHGANAGLEALERIEEQTGTGFQPLWAAKAELLSEIGARAPAIKAYEKAISLATDIPLRKFLEMKKQQIL